MNAFTQENQLKKTLPEFDRYADILPKGEGPYTMQGLRTNVRVGIAYMHGWNKDIGCVAFDNLMEDLATLEISRAQTWQWLHHQVLLSEGEKVQRDLVQKLFNEECTRIIEEWKVAGTPVESELFAARDQAFELFTKTELQDFFSLASDPV